MKLLKFKNVKLKNDQDKIFDLFKYQGNSWLLLIFFRGEWCLSCRSQLTEINRNLQWFRKRKIKIVAISADDYLYTNVLKEILRLNFMVIADPKWAVFKKFGFKKPSNPKRIKPAIFLSNPRHQIIFQYIGKNTKDRPSLAKLRNIIKTNTI